MCPYSDLFWSVFSLIQSEYEEILCISPYSVNIRRNADQNNSEHEHISRSVKLSQPSMLVTCFQNSKINSFLPRFYAFRKLTNNHC